MALKFTLTKFIACCLVLIAALGALLAINLGNGSTNPEEARFPGITLGLTAEAREALQAAGDAFPSNDAGFSAYYRVGTPGSYALDKSAVDDHVFSKPLRAVIDRRASPAEVLDMGANYTVARMPLLNIGGLTTPVNVYYDDQGWVVAYLPRNIPSSQVWQAWDLDAENPKLTDISNTTLLDAINVVIAEELNQTPVAADDTGLGYYHWQYPQADNFLMMAVARGEQGDTPVSFAIPESLEVREASAAMWLYGFSDSDAVAPCAAFALDGSYPVEKTCANGFHSAFIDLDTLKGQVSHVMKLTHSEQDAGASGALLMLVYSAP